MSKEPIQEREGSVQGGISVSLVGAGRVEAAMPSLESDITTTDDSSLKLKQLKHLARRYLNAGTAHVVGSFFTRPPSDAVIKTSWQRHSSALRAAVDSISLNPYRTVRFDIRKAPPASNEESLRSDWYAVGNDLAVATFKYTETVAEQYGYGRSTETKSDSDSESDCERPPSVGSTR